MELKELTNEILKLQNISEDVKGDKQVTWAFSEVKILSMAGNSQEAGSGGMTDDSSQTEIIDPENQDKPPTNGESGGESGGEPNGEPGGGDSGGSESNEVKPGSIIQDMETGEYGEVISVDANGDVEWKPVDKDQVQQQGYSAKKRNTKINIEKPTIKGNIDGFLG